ncbi:SMC family ATPase [Clostridium sp. WLY-B-L2]|uniref:Nuclease SbcCD subunit C n=1 Tax=Clostridium aromativorans TaxID=2836848 RepID=A0ABS8N912_9CLOT|nr:SMC family ATPase [Clostridium aromativorans]MCC9295203.1 SMC family ATPase [Clostridium aromativorans]
MKPIKLKIKGLNSFMDTQEIDFKKLTCRGIFGIFGPTGSGKSTVLDGITLALYGEIARKSSNFMNVNCTDLMVSYEFQISDRVVRIYRVEREFRRENRTGKVRSKSARILDITTCSEKILEEGAKSVTEKCEEILGLKLEDFTRTVVLPQGKFSEFLRLEGKDRRNMLERLFGLQKYGDELSFKLGSKVKKEREKENLIQGQLTGYEGIDEKILKEKESSLEEIKKQYHQCETEYNDVEKKFNIAGELWKLQMELNEKINQQKSMLKMESYIGKCERKVTLAESALKVKPYMDSCENTLRQVEILRKELLDLNGSMDSMTQYKNEMDTRLSVIEEKRHRELPELKVKQQKILDAIAEGVILKKLQSQEMTLRKDIDFLKGELQTKNNEGMENRKHIEKLLDSIKFKEELVNCLKISEEYKEKIDDGIIVLKDYENIQNRKNSLLEDIKDSSTNIENERKKGKTMQENMDEKQKLIDRAEDQLKELMKNCPGDENTLLDFQKKVVEIKSKWDKYGDYKNIIEKNKKILHNLKKELKDKSSTESALRFRIHKLDEEIKKCERHSMANILRNTLSEGDLCPVCGSVYCGGRTLDEIDTGSVEKLRKHLGEKQRDLENMSEEIIKIRTVVESEQKIIGENGKKLNELGESFKSTPVEFIQNEFTQLRNRVYLFNSRKSELDKKIKSLKEEKNFLNIEYNKISAARSQNEIQMKKLKQNLKEEDEKFKIEEKKLCSLKAELGIVDFKGKKNEINENERKKADLEIEIRKLRDNLTAAQLQGETLSSEIASLKGKLNERQTEFREKNKNMLEKKRSIKNRVGEVEDLEYLNKQVSAHIEKIEMEYVKVKGDSKKAQVKYDEYKNKIIACQSNLVSSNERKSDESEKLERVLNDQHFENTDQVKKSFINKLEINELNKKIHEYRDSLVKLKGTVENLREKIGGKTLTEEQWLEIQNIKDKKSCQLKNLYECKIRLQEEVNSINTKLLQLKDVLKKKEKVEHKLALLDDLEKLFKGKKFVEFVAGNQLKYISLEADKKLKEITCGNYGLEVDEDGRFFIRDYKNGGKKRDASTLSGGETFVTSLALALALSLQIQLKGRAPLELFFLDEGFGTLDENLLETVMDSLEKIHNDKLSIGIISHLESIKERMPVKLIVTPAESGMGGSKAKIELG